VGKFSARQVLFATSVVHRMTIMSRGHFSLQGWVSRNRSIVHILVLAYLLEACRVDIILHRSKYHFEVISSSFYLHNLNDF